MIIYLSTRNAVGGREPIICTHFFGVWENSELAECTFGMTQNLFWMICQWEWWQMMHPKKVLSQNQVYTRGNEQCLVNKHCTKQKWTKIKLNYNVWSLKNYEIFCIFNLCLHAKNSSIHVWAKNIPAQHVS